ncbi:WLM-domain-containing protein [Mycena floridula]|nr:WLM-domain-containing protein [Mycena floridula]
MSSVTATISHRGTSHSLSLLPESTILSLQLQLQELTGIPPELQKLLYKGKKPSHHGELTLKEAGFTNGMKIQMLSTTTKELEAVLAADNEQQRRERILKERALKAPVKLRSTGSANSASLNFRFHQLTPLPHLPNPSSAHDVLRRLSDDPAIQHVMQQHQFSVGILTELAPHEHPNLLGLNVNRGEQIKLRLRTNNLQGFRPYGEIRRVLCHELTHNVHGDHDNDFKELNSQLNREVAQFERAKKEGTHYLSDPGYVYEPSSELEAEAAEATVHVLGGSSSSSSSDTAEERRRRVLQAAMSRIRKEEEEIEGSCGTTS